MSNKRRGAFQFDHERLPELLGMIGKYHTTHIAIHFNLDRSTVIYYQHKHNIPNQAVRLPIPQIDEMYRQRRSAKQTQRAEYLRIRKDESYDEKLVREEARMLERRSNCQHLVWVKKCSACSAILESDKQVNTHYKVHEQ